MVFLFFFLGVWEREIKIGLKRGILFFVGILVVYKIIVSFLDMDLVTVFVFRVGAIVFVVVGYCVWG